MVELTQKRLQDVQRGGISVQRGSSEDLPFGDSEFDRYFSNFVLHLTPEPSNMLREAYRVLKPGIFMF